MAKWQKAWEERGDVLLKVLILKQSVEKWLPLAMNGL